MSEKKTIAAPAAKEAEASFADLFSASTHPAARITIGEVVSGTVIAIGKESIFLNLGARAEGMIDKDEFMRQGRLTVQEGDVLQVQANSFQDGVFQCSSRCHTPVCGDAHRSRDDSSRRVLQDALSRGLPVEGRVKAVIKGGFEVQVLGLRAFCPISQIERNHCQEPQAHLDRTYAFMVLQYEEDGRNIVVGRRDLLLDEERQEAQRRWQDIAEGQVIEGTVTSVHEYGAFIDIGGLEGLLHVSEISYRQIGDAREAIRSGQKLSLAVSKLDPEKNKISLSLKALQPDPWIEAAEKISVGSVLPGIVVRLKNFGAFVELFPGVVGLLHISQLAASRRISHPREVLSVGQAVQARVLSVDPGQKTISLTMEESDADCSEELLRLKENQEQDLRPAKGTLSDLLDRAISRETPGRS
jgi:small subunit ribosomal protein S1